MTRQDQDAMLDRLAAGDVRALARALSMVEDGTEGAAPLLAGCRALGRRAHRIGLTGPPGAGKSTLTDGIVRELRARGETVGVLAIDPSSPYTGGALLGDRIRMQGFAGDAGVYIRSMASRSTRGGLARSAADACMVMEASGRGTIVIETVGVGQEEGDLGVLADVTVLVLVPGLGDDVQSLKAGIMEVADVYVVNKSDLPGADKVEREILAMQSLSMEHAAWVPPVVRTVASTGEGVPDLLAAIERCMVVRGETDSARPATLLGAADLLLRQGQQPASKPGGATLDHLGIAVRSIASARTFYDLLGLHVEHEETVEHEQVRTAMLPLGESRLELLEATAQDSTIGRFVARRGEGMHHVALRVVGIDKQFAQMQAAGVRLASDSVRVGAGGHRYFFVHPASTGGVLVELVEPKKD